MKHNILSQISLCGLLLSLALMGSCGQRSEDQRLQSQVSEQSRHLCPRTVNTGITLDSMSYHPDNTTVYYYYTMDDSIYKPEAIASNMELVRVKLLNALVGSVELKQFKEHHVTFDYSYRSKREPAKELMRFVFAPKDYGAK